MAGKVLRIALVWLAALAAASGFPAPAWAETMSETVPVVLPETVPEIELTHGALAEVNLSGGAADYVFTAASNSAYDVCLFPAGDGEPAIRVQLWQGGELLAEGEGGLPAVSLRLAAGERYAIRLSGTGRARLEVARHALSRCFAMPMPLDAEGDRYAKAFARAGDVHWYQVTQEAEFLPGAELPSEAAFPLALAGVPGEAGLRLELRLFDEAGRLLAEGEPTAGGACLMDYVSEAGRPLWLRVSAERGATGLYELRLQRGDGGEAPDRLSLSRRELLLSGRESARLDARFSPAGTGGLVYWESSDPSVAEVDDRGRVTGRGPGIAVVTAYGAGGVSARCRVEVEYVPVAGVRLLAERVALNAGDDAAIECAVLPANASDPRLEYAIEPAGVAEIDASGVLRGLAEGEATLTVHAADGGWTDAVPVTVSPAPKRWRALLVGEQGYASTVAAVRTGSANSVAGIRSMLGELSMDGARWQVSTKLDISRDGALAAIGEAFAGASDGDMNLFYITCHGEYAGGMTCFRMYDGSVLTAAELAQALGRVPGGMLVIIDCCGSGGAIGRASEPGDILKGIDAVFSGMRGPAVMGGSRFMVLASAALEQDSYRVSFGEGGAESAMATAFARALCEAGGWSIDRGGRGAMRADADYDGVVTLNELYAYTARRVMWMLSLAGRLSDGAAYAQSVQVWPEGCAEAVFAR